MRAAIVGAALLAGLVMTAAPYAIDAQGAQGGDVSQLYSSSTYACTVSNGGWSFMIVRGYCSYGGVDPNGLQNLQNAAAGGIQYVDYYHFPCAYGVGAASQVQASVSAMSGSYGTMWLDIETNPSPNCGWSSDLNQNCNFLQQMIQEGQALGSNVGIYASSYMWSSIMGDGCTVGSDAGLPLWYADYDYVPSFASFSSFGGWSSPAMKQYWDSVGINCEISADADWYP
jgi:GH25 family lysozyme M1 (1,4-beta-N-acetylmuramidase)